MAGLELGALIDGLADVVAARVVERLEIPDDTVLDTKGIAAQLGMSVDATTRACQRGEIPARKLAGKYRITRRALLEFVEAPVRAAQRVAS